MPNENPIPLPGTSLDETPLGSSTIIVSGCQNTQAPELLEKNAVNFPDITLLDDIATEPCAEWLSDKTWNDEAAPK